ncbi:MAG: hypothetical protein ACYC3W_09315 [Candidatus Nanopelagicales bacterium]
MVMTPIKPSTGQSRDNTAALRQQRRRDRLKAQQSKKIVTILTQDQTEKLRQLQVIGYAPDQSTILARGLDEAYAREIDEKEPR